MTYLLSTAPPSERNRSPRAVDSAALGTGQARPQGLDNAPRRRSASPLRVAHTAHSPGDDEDPPRKEMDIPVTFSFDGTEPLR